MQAAEDQGSDTQNLVHQPTVDELSKRDTYLSSSAYETRDLQLPRGMQIGRWVLNYVSLRVCVWLFVHGCLQVNLQTFLEPVKWSNSTQWS